MSNPRDYKEPFSTIITYIMETKKPDMEELRRRYVSMRRAEENGTREDNPGFRDLQAWGNMRRLLEGRSKISFTTFKMILDLLQFDLQDMQFRIRDRKTREFHTLELHKTK